MKQLLYILISLTITLQACREEAIDPALRVRPVLIDVSVIDNQYVVSWQPISIVCITSPCPDVADVEAEEYEIQIADSELGDFRRYATVQTTTKSITIPALAIGRQLIVRVGAKNKSASSKYSNIVMASAEPLREANEFSGYGTADNTWGEDIALDGSRTIFSTFVEKPVGNYEWPLYITNLVNGTPVNVSLLTQSARGATLSPDGKQVAYRLRDQNRFRVVNVETDRTYDLPVTDLTWLRAMDWSPDGRWIAYTTVSNEETRLWKVAATGGAPIALTPVLPVKESNHIGQGGIQWTPDGRYIALSRTRLDPSGTNWRSAISLYATDGSGEVDYYETRSGWTDRSPSFSPDGKQLAFLSSRTNTYNANSLWIRDVATKQVRQIRIPVDQQLSDTDQPRWIGNNKIVYKAYVQQGTGLRQRFFIISV